MCFSFGENIFCCLHRNRLVIRETLSLNFRVIQIRGLNDLGTAFWENRSYIFAFQYFFRYLSYVVQTARCMREMKERLEIIWQWEISANFYRNDRFALNKMTYIIVILCRNNRIVVWKRISFSFSSIYDY